MSCFSLRILQPNLSFPPDAWPGTPARSCDAVLEGHRGAVWCVAACGSGAALSCPFLPRLPDELATPAAVGCSAKAAECAATARRAGPRQPPGAFAPVGAGPAGTYREIETLSEHTLLD